MSQQDLDEASTILLFQEKIDPRVWQAIARMFNVNAFTSYLIVEGVKHELIKELVRSEIFRNAVREEVHMNTHK